jgi:hypothetical protein
MKITTKKTIEVTEEITLPAYYKSLSGNFHWKIYSEKECLQVYTDEIGIKHAGIFLAIDYEPSTPDEFLEAYNKTLSTLENLI